MLRTKRTKQFVGNCWCFGQIPIDRDVSLCEIEDQSDGSLIPTFSSLNEASSVLLHRTKLLLKEKMLAKVDTRYLISYTNFTLIKLPRN